MGQTTLWPPEGREEIDRRWLRHLVGGGSLETHDGALRLVDREASAAAYTNAQVDDYQGLPRRSLPWRPPLTLTVRARFSHPGGPAGPAGTAGFGFWNDPFGMTQARLPALPQAIWFFYASPPSDMKLDLRTPGCGWKAATLDASGWPARLALPLAIPAVPFFNIRPLYRAAWPLAQRLLRVCEAPVQASMAEWHTYVLRWRPNAARFEVDGQVVLACDMAPRGPLGFVLWIDNQYLVATPWGRLRYGFLDAPAEQWLEVAALSIAPGP